MIHTVQDLINALMKVKDKTKPIKVYTEGGFELEQDFQNVHSIDYDLSDRVDINIVD